MSVLGMMFGVIFSTGEAPVRIENCELEKSYLICDITNGYERAIRSIRFDVLLTDKNRTVPWAEPDGRQASGTPQIQGGIEPKETVRIRLMLMAHIPSRADLETLQIELLNFAITGPDGEPLN